MKLANGEPLPEKNRDHNLCGEYSGCRECHITPDWLLVCEELILKQADLYGRAADGDYTEVNYLEIRDPKWGIRDGNYTNRLRLAYYLLFTDIDDEKMVEKLFLEELKDRETNDFHGIGTTMEMLTCLLMRYNQNGQYDALFERAKNANFDCACGYDRDVKIEADLNKYHIFDGISIAVEMEYLDCAQKLVQLWKESVTDWTEQEYWNLISFNKQIGREIDNEEALLFLLDTRIRAGQNKDIISAWKNLIHYYVQFDRCQQAYESFMDMLDKTNLSEIYHIRLFTYILEDCLELICKYREKSEILWNWAKPFVEKKAGNPNGMFGNLYTKSIQAAETVNDEYAKELSAKYEVWKEKIKL